VFRNLFFFSKTFRNHNFNDFFGDLRRDSEGYFETALRSGYTGEQSGVEPYFYQMFPTTMAPETCSSFIRANPDLPITERDYCLSKLFQFIYVPLVERFGLEYGESDVREQIETFLDSIGAELLPHLSKFDWLGFYDNTHQFEIGAILDRLPEHLPPVANFAGGDEPERMAAKKIHRIQFSTPHGAGWPDVSIRFISDHRVQIQVLDKRGTYNFIELGFEDARTRTAGGSGPDKCWATLQLLAREHGYISCSEFTAKQFPIIKKQIQTIQKRLKEFFRIASNPLYWDRASRTYRSRFRIERPAPDRF
jgi:hypothetical protein